MEWGMGYGVWGMGYGVWGMVGMVGINRGRNAWMKGEGNDVCLQCTRIRCSQILKCAPQICVHRY